MLPHFKNDLKGYDFIEFSYYYCLQYTPKADE